MSRAPVSLTNASMRQQRLSCHCLLVASLLFILLLGACKIGPNAPSYDREIPEAFTAAKQTEETQKKAIEISKWWEQFNDEILTRRIIHALKDSPDILQAAARVKEARALAKAAGAYLWPTVDAYSAYSYSENYTLPYSLASSPAKGTYTVSLGAFWELDVWGVNQRRIEALTDDAKSAEMQAQFTRIVLAAEVAKQEILGRGLAARMRVLRDTIKAQNETLKLVSYRRKAGLTTEAPVAQAQAQLASLQELIPKLRESLVAAENRLAVLLGKVPGTVRIANVAAQYDAPLVPIAPEPPPALPSEVLLRRPDVASANYELRAATARIGVEEGELYPKFQLTSIVGVTRLSVDDFFMGANRYFSLGPSVQWRLFNRQQIRDRIAAAGAVAERALVEHDKTVLLALEDVENALTALDATAARSEALKKTVEAATYSTALVSRQYREGLGDFLSLLVEQQRLFTAREKYEEIKTLHALNLIALYKAIGGGWDPSMP